MMTFNRVSIVCLFLSLAAFSSRADAQNGVSPSSPSYVSDGAGVATAADFSGSYLFGNDGGTYLLFDKLIGNASGFDDGHTRLGLRAKLLDSGDSHLWGSGYVLITDNTRVGVNAGGGFRWLNDGNIIGVNAWFDSYETNNGNRFSQATAGFELLHEEVDFRINGYMPLGNEEEFLRVTDPGTVSVFTSRGIGFLGRGLDEQALKGVDAEVGTMIYNVPWARIYGGGYVYDGKSTSFGGIRGRVETAISPDLSLNFSVQNDTEFDTNYNLSIEYRFSGGLPQQFFPPFHGESRKYHPVRRQWPVATQVVDVPTNVPMLSAKTGQALVLAFVDNTNAGPGDGSFENPFSDLPSSVDSDGVLVFTGAGTTFGNITLNDCQFLFGEGKAQTLFDPIRGTVTLPAPFNAAGPRPVLMATNPAENVVTLANMNRVANFDILGPATAAIGGMDITDFEINMVDAYNVTDGFHIANASGRGVIIMSHVEAADQNVFISNTGGGPLDLQIEGLTTYGGTEGLHLVASGDEINANVTGFRADDVTGAGMIFDAWMGGTLNAFVDDAIVGSTGGLTGSGFELNVLSNGSMGVNMTNIAARGMDDLFVVDVQDGQFIGTIAGGVPGFIAGADFSDSVTGSGVRVNLDNAVGRLTFSSLFANRNAVNGIETDADGAGTDFLIEVLDSRLIANGDSAFDTDVTGGAMLRYFVDPTFATMSGVSGFEYNVSGPGTIFIADIFQTDFSDSALHAIDGFVFNGAFANIDVTDVFGDNAGPTGNGYNLVVDQNSQFIGTATNASFTLAGDAGIDLTVSDGSSASLVMNDIQGQTNGDYGLMFLVEDGVNGPSDLFLAITNGDFNSNPDSNIIGTASGAGSLASVYLTNVTADDMGNNGAVALTAEMGGILNATWNTGTVSQGDSDGFVLRVDDPGSQLRLALDTVAIGTNSGDGIDAMLMTGGAGSLLNISLVNSAVTQNQGNGIDLDLAGPGARSFLVIDNTPVTGNFGGDGLEFDVTGGAGLFASAFGAASDFSGNFARAWDGSVSGMGSFATLDFNGTHAIASGLEGGVFDVTAGGLLNLSLANLIIGDSPLDGLVTTVDGAGSVANIIMNGITMQRNGLSLIGDAFEARATNGGLITATLSNMAVIDNREDGFLFDASTGGSILASLDNILADNNGRHGLEFHASSGGSFDGTVTQSSFSQSGGVFVANGVYGTAIDPGSVASVLLDGVISDNNSRMGFEFDVRGGATLLADIRSGGFFGNSSGSGNAADGVRFFAQDPGTMGFLKMMGPNTFDDNVGNGINYDAVGVDMAVAQVSGTLNNNGADGIDIRMVNVNSGAISLQGSGAATITGNGGDGIDITTQNVNLVDTTVNGMLIDDFLIDGFTVTANGGDPIIVDMTNTTVQHGEITGNTTDGGLNGISVSLNGGSVDLLIDGNVVTNAQQYGIVVTSGAGMHNVDVTNNLVTSSGDTNIFVDLFGTTETGLMINDNSVIGGGLGAAQFTIGTNFTGMTFTNAMLLGTASIPPDTMGAVGPTHIVEFVNQGVTIFNRDGSVAVATISLDQFFLNAGLPDTANGVFDPRIIYDPTVDRWFVAAIDSVAMGGNNIYIGVSNTSDPTMGFSAFRFVGDTVDNVRFNDFETLGLDADGIYLATNNFGGPGGFDVSIYSIPKADLLGGIPTIANLSRFEALDSTMFGETPQPVVDFGPSDGLAQFVGTLFPGGSSVQRVDVVGAGTPAAAIGVPVNVTTPFYVIGPGGRQPNPFLLPLEPPSPRFSGNVIEIGDSLWAVQDVQGSFINNSAVRWYEIDSVTNTVLQTGLIEDPNLDFIASSINVNPVGAVMIGFTGSGPGQFASSMAAFGTTDGGGTTTFQTPTVLQAGVANYEITFGSGRNRWGDYSATVVDPTDPNTFWTFQELVVGPNDYGVQITEVTFSQSVLGGTTGDGIHVDVRDTARMTASTINGNTATTHGDDGIEVLIADTAQVDDLMVNGNIVTDNGDDAIHIATASPNIVGGLTVSGNTDISGNAGDGIEIILNDLNPAMRPDVAVDGNTVTDNLGRGIVVSALNSSLGDVTAVGNTVQNNTGGNGITIDLDNMTGGVINTNSVDVSMNSVSSNPGDAINVRLNNISGVQSFDMSQSMLMNNGGGGLSLTANNSSITMIQAADNAIIGNTGGAGILMSLTDSGTNLLSITGSNIEGNTGDGVDLDLDNSPIGSLVIQNNNTALPGMTGGISGNLGDGVLLDAANGSDIGALLIDGNLLDANLSHGIEVLVQSSTLPVMGGLVSNNMISNHADGDGFRMLNADTSGTPFEIDFIDNMITDNGAMSNGIGINISLGGSASGMTSTMTGNAIMNNGGLGVSFLLNDDSSLDLTVGDSAANQNVIAANTDAGIGIRTADMAVANIVVENTNIMGTIDDGSTAAFNGDGLAVHSSGFSVVETLTIGDSLLANTSFSGNAGNGIDLELSENSRNPNILIQNVMANMNTDHGIGITRTDFSSFTEDLDSDGVIDPGEDVNGDGMLGNAMITMSTASGNGGNGLDVMVSGAQLPVQQIDISLNQNSFSANTIGMNFTVNNDAILRVSAANNLVMGNMSHGINVTTNQNSAFGNVLPSGGDPNSPMAVPSTFSSNLVLGNGGSGFNFVANDTSVQAIDIDDAGAVNLATGTSRTVIDGNAGNQVQITGNGTSQQNIDLTAVDITNVGGVATGDGVNIAANATSTVDVSISGGMSGPSIIGAAMPQVALPGLGGDGIDANVASQAILNLNVSDVNLFNNAGDAIHIRNTGPVTTGNQAGGSGERQTIQAMFNNVDARLNGDQGLDVLLTGNIGGRAAQGDTDTPVLIDVMNSNFSSNNNEGIFFRAQPGFTHGGNNFYADLIAEFNVVNSIIQSNGTTTITDGLVMEIGTNAYVLSNISGNLFGANGADDFHTNSFDSGAQANTAALDLAFQNNSGDHIRPTAVGTAVGSTFFILDNGLTVEPNNNFQLFGVPQMEVFGPDGFFTNSYILRPMSNHGDPTFPP